MFAPDETATDSNPLSTVDTQPAPHQPGPALNPPNGEVQDNSQALNSQAEGLSIDPLAVTEDALIQTESMSVPMPAHDAADAVDSVIETESLNTESAHVSNDVPTYPENTDMVVSHDGQNLVEPVLQVTKDDFDEPASQHQNQQLQQVDRHTLPPAQEQGHNETPAPVIDHPTIPPTEPERPNASAIPPSEPNNFDDHTSNPQQNPASSSPELRLHPKPRTPSTQRPPTTSQSLLTKSRTQSQPDPRRSPQSRPQLLPQQQPKPKSQPKPQHQRINPPPPPPPPHHNPQSSLSSYKHTILNRHRRTPFWGGRKIDFVKGERHHLKFCIELCFVEGLILGVAVSF